MNLLQAALNVDPNPSKGGGEITIVNGTALLSETGPAGSIADVEVKKPTDVISIYVVRAGDSLSQIAEMFGVSRNTIIWANDLRGATIREGQTLVILPVSGVQHTVKLGDTLKGIATKYKADIDEIAQFNDVTIDAKLAIGDVIIVPDGDGHIESSAPRTTPKVATNLTNYIGYYLRPISGGVKTQGIHGYNGIDIGTSAGTPVLASAAGHVIVSRGSGWNGGYGLYIVISHANGTQTLYAHNSKNIVVPGQQVVQGQVIGYVGNTGKSTGPHLHFEVRGARNPF
ncbi:MAG: peptidoglycan DD-metalloendopeptidase family protein [bacterium]|nr:peptidoglycan DD-metalloendopeptidase family protein [bacterium]